MKDQTQFSYICNKNLFFETIFSFFVPSDVARTNHRFFLFTTNRKQAIKDGDKEGFAIKLADQGSN